MSRLDISPPTGDDGQEAREELEAARSALGGLDEEGQANLIRRVFPDLRNKLADLTGIKKDDPGEERVRTATDLYVSLGFKENMLLDNVIAFFRTAIEKREQTEGETGRTQEQKRFLEDLERRIREAFALPDAPTTTNLSYDTFLGLILGSFLDIYDLRMLWAIQTENDVNMRLLEEQKPE